MKLSSGALVERFTSNDCHKRAENSGTQAPRSLALCERSVAVNNAIRYLHMTHNPLRCWGVTSRINVWYHDKNLFGELAKPAANA